MLNTCAFFCNAYFWHLVSIHPEAVVQIHRMSSQHIIIMLFLPLNMLHVRWWFMLHVNSSLHAGTQSGDSLWLPDNKPNFCHGNTNTILMLHVLISFCAIFVFLIASHFSCTQFYPKDLFFSLFIHFFLLIFVFTFLWRIILFMG